MPGTLHLITPDTLARVRPVFTAPYPVPARLWAMLDGAIPARLYVDSSEVATWALLQELAEGTVYVGGRIPLELLGSAIQVLRQVQDVVICAWPASGFAVDSLPPPDYRGVAVEFTGRSPAVDLAPMTALPAHYQLRRIEPAVAPLLAGFDDYVAMLGSAAGACALVRPAHPVPAPRPSQGDRSPPPCARPGHLCRCSRQPPGRGQARSASPPRWVRRPLLST